MNRVQLLRDGHGVYGIDGGESGDHHYQRRVLLLRPDRLNEDYSAMAALQMITGGFQGTIFRNTLEEYFRRTIHCSMLGRAGLPWPPLRDRSDREQIGTPSRRPRHAPLCV